MNDMFGNRQPLNEILSMMSRIDESYPETSDENGTEVSGENGIIDIDNLPEDLKAVYKKTQNDPSAKQTFDRYTSKDQKINFLKRRREAYLDNTFEDNSGNNDDWSQIGKYRGVPSLINTIISNRLSIKAPGAGPKKPFREYTLPLVMDLCSTIINRKFIIYHDVDTDIAKAKPVQQYIGDFKDWHSVFLAYKENPNGRFGFAFEMLMGNKPDADPTADLENSNYDESVEAKSKDYRATSHSISITGRKIESLTEQLKDIINSDIILKCEYISALLNDAYDSITKDYKKIEENVTYDGLKIEGEKNFCNSKINFNIENEQDAVLYKESYHIIDNGKIKYILNYRINSKIIIRNNKIFIRITPEREKGEVNNYPDNTILTKDYDINGYKVKLPMGNEVVELPMEIVLNSVTQKCPNIAIAYGESNLLYDSKIKKECTAFYFSNFEFFKKNKNMNNPIIGLMDLFKKNAFELKISSTNNNSYSHSKSKYPISFKIIPSFNVDNFNSYLSDSKINNNDKLYIKV